jgi:hypothetical protein
MKEPKFKQKEKKREVKKKHNVCTGKNPTDQ